MSRLEGRVAIVTGASRGIGAALAQRLVAEGADVLLVARTLDQHDHLPGSLSETADRCRRLDRGSVAVLAADLSDETSRATIVPSALEQFGGRLDILVNNAAAAIYHPILEYPLRRRRLTFEVNVHGPADLMQAAIPVMRDQGAGWIVNVSSGTGRYERGFPSEPPADPMTLGVYGASKSALNRMTYAFAAELVGTGIRANTIEPRSAVATEGATMLAGGAFDPAFVESLEEMVEATLMLCDCSTDWTGGIHTSLDLLEQFGTPVHDLSGDPL